jgi:hypothetical protein
VEETDTQPALVVGVRDAAASEDTEQEYGWLEIELNAGDLVKMDSKSGRFIFEKDGVTVILNRIREKSFSFDAF